MANPTEATPVSLLRERSETPRFPGLERIGARFERGLLSVITALSGGAASVTRNPAQITDFGGWRSEQTSFGALCRYQLTPIKGSMVLAIPPALILQMVDLFYGGTGIVSMAAREAFTDAESRYLTRLGEQCLPLLTTAWADIAALTPTLIGIETDIASAKFGKDSDLIVVQSFAVQIGDGKAATVACLYPIAALRPIAALSDAPQPEAAPPSDPIWRDRLSEAVLEVRLPMRSIFARPELPLGQLLSLKAGDVIPVCLPNHIPITVAGRLFAQGTVGESGGRAAIKIEKIEQGSLNHE